MIAGPCNDRSRPTGRTLERPPLAERSGSSRPPSDSLGGVRGGEFELDVVRIAEDEDIDREGWPEVSDLGVRHAALVEDADRVLKIGSAGDGEAQVIEADTVLIETIAPGGASGIVMGADAEPHLAVAQERTRVEVHELLEPQNVGVERDRPVDIADGQPEVMDAPSRNLVGHTAPPCPSWSSVAQLSARVPWLSRPSR